MGWLSPIIVSDIRYIEFERRAPAECPECAAPVIIAIHLNSNPRAPVDHGICAWVSLLTKGGAPGHGVAVILLPLSETGSHGSSVFVCNLFALGNSSTWN
jgi:hypothetical protein